MSGEKVVLIIAVAVIGIPPVSVHQLSNSQQYNDHRKPYLNHTSALLLTMKIEYIYLSASFQLARHH